MSKTVILLNPMGTDVTPYVNHTSGYAQLMNGTVAAPGDTVYTLPYTNQSGVSNISAGVGMLDTKLKATSGEILVFGYSEGCQIADWWLADQGSTPATGVSPSLVSFLMIGNADRKYGGFAYNRSVFNSVGYTAGKPDNTPYTVVDFARQYDPICDFPTAAPIVNALTGLSYVGSDNNVYAGAMQAVAAVMASTPYSNAVSNAAVGLAIIHTGLGIAGTGYMSVTVSDATNVSLADGNITWVWSPTYPVPMLGFGGTFPQTDLQLRTQIEQAYSRPVNIPMPNYGKNTGWGVEPFPLPVSPPPVTGWWAELHVSAHITIQPAVAASSGHHANVAIVTGVTVTAVAHSVHLVSVAKTVAPTVTAHVVLVLPTSVAKTVTPSVTASVTLIKIITAAITVSPTVSGAGRDRDGVTISIAPTVSVSAILNGHVVHAAKTITPTVTTSGVVTRFATESIFVQPSVTAAAVVYKHANVAATVTPSVTVTGGVTRHGAAALTAAPSVAAGVHAEVHTTVTVTPPVTTSARVIKGAQVAKTITPTISTAWLLTRFGNAALTITPSVSGVARDRDGATLIITPSVSAVGHAVKSKNAALTVTPTIFATARVLVSVAKTVTPTVASTSRTRVSEAITVTPSVAVAAGKIRFGNEAITVTPTVSVSATVLVSVSKTITPTVSVTGSNIAGILFDAVGAGKVSAAASSISWTHTATAGAYALVFVGGTFGSAKSISGVTFGGTSMASLGSVYLDNNNGSGHFYLFGLASVSAGSNTVTATLSGGGTPSLAGNSLTYTGVTSVGTPSTNFGLSGSASQALTCSANQVIAQAFLAGHSFSASGGGTQRYNGSATGIGLLIQDSTSSATFTGTLTSSAWGGVGAVLS